MRACQSRLRPARALEIWFEIPQHEQFVAQLARRRSISAAKRIGRIMASQRIERAQVVGDRIAMGRMGDGATAGIDAVPVGLRPDAAPRRMHGQRVECSASRSSSRARWLTMRTSSSRRRSVSSPPNAASWVSACLKVYSASGNRRRLVDEFVGAQRRQAGCESIGGQVGNLDKQGEGEVLTDHGGGLQSALNIRVEAVDASRQHGLHGRRHGDVAHVADDPALHRARRPADRVRSGCGRFPRGRTDCLPCGPPAFFDRLELDEPPSRSSSSACADCGGKACRRRRVK